MPSLIDDISTRVARLERSSGRDRAIGFAVLALLVATAQAPAVNPGTSQPVVVRDAAGNAASLYANGLRVSDAAGHERLFAGIDSSGLPSIDLHDSKGQLRESMYLQNDLPTLRLFDSDGKRRAEIRLDSSQDGELLINDANEKLRLALFRASSGDPQLALYGSDAKIRAFFATDDASPYLVMRDAAGLNRVNVGGYSDGSIGLSIRDASNALLWKAP
jgi:hypothetical protein